MNVASLELCEELYKLSGWSDTYFVHWYKEVAGAFDANQWFVSPRVIVHQDSVPAYDLGYLLRKLPAYLNSDEDTRDYFYMGRDIQGLWLAAYQLVGVDEPDEYYYTQMSATPEDAVAQLAIELFERGILETK